MGINRDAWLKAIADTQAPFTDDPDAMSAPEFADLYHCGEAAARVRLKKLQAEGKVEKVSKYVQDSGGSRRRVPAWRLVTKATTKTRK